jgi:nucleoside recognition membrane protein YjiH
MRRLIIISALCLAAILIGAIYTLIDGIICGSYLGVTLSLTCIAALFMGIRYFRKMVQQATEEESY